MPSDATLLSEKIGGAELSKMDSHVSIAANNDQPIGIITLEDVLEELLCEEILDEYDDRGNEEEDFRTFLPPPSPDKPFKTVSHSDDSGDDHDSPDGNAKSDSKGGSTTAGASTKADSDAPQYAIYASPLASPTPAHLKKTVFGRLGIGRQKQSTRESDTSTVEQNLTRRHTLTDRVVDSPPQAEPEGESKANATPQQPAVDYFAPPLPRAIRSASMPPEQDRVAMGDQETVVVQDEDGQQIEAPLLSPQPSRPVVVRAQVPGNPVKTVIASESLLRGRPTAAAVAKVSSATQTSSSRSQTPVSANRGNRFKSQAVTTSQSLPPKGRQASATEAADGTNSKQQTPKPEAVESDTRKDGGDGDDDARDDSQNEEDS